MRSIEQGESGSYGAGFAVNQWEIRHHSQHWAEPTRSTTLDPQLDPTLKIVRDHEEFSQEGLEPFVKKLESLAKIYGENQKILHKIATEIKAATPESDSDKREKALFDALYSADFVVKEMIEGEELAILGDPKIASDFLIEELAYDDTHRTGLPDFVLTDLIGPEAKDQTAEPDDAATIKEGQKTVLIARLVHQLRGSLTPEGIYVWFTSEPDWLEEGITPLDLIDRDVEGATEPLMTFARGLRG